MLEDRFGLALTTDNASAVTAYVTGLDLLLSAQVGAGALLDEAIGLDGDFALAHIARARLMQMAADGGQAKASADRARRLMADLSLRERGHVEITALVVEGRGAEAYPLLEEHLSAYPRDALPLSLALGVYGLLGFSGRPDHHRAQRELLEGMAPRWGGDWWFDTYLGWSRIETGDRARGLKTVAGALADNPRNGHAAHAYAHGFYETGDVSAGLDFLTGWLPAYDSHAPLHCHLSWHHALLELARGNSAAAETIYHQGIRPTASHSNPMFTLVDCAGFLWRGVISGHPPADSDTREAAAYAVAHFPHAGLAFVNVHTALALAACGDRDGLDAHLAEVRQLVAAGRQPPGEVVETVCRGIAAFARRDYHGAAELLATAETEIDRIGGSHAQRDIVTDTLIAAHLRAGRRDRAERAMLSRSRRRAGHLDAAWLERMTDYGDSARLR